MKKNLLILSIAICGIANLPCRQAGAQTPNWAWAKGAKSNGQDFGYSVTTDASGNVFITGTFQRPYIIFGTDTLFNSDLGGNVDMFIVKYDASGNVLWAKGVGIAAYDEAGNGVCTDASGNVFVTGYFSGATITFGSTTLTNAGGVDIFIAKYDNSGNVLWAKSGAGTGNDDVGNSVSADASGNVFVTGNFNSTSITFGSTTLTNSGIGPMYYAEVFLVKYDASGNVLWAKSGAGSSNNDYGKSVSVDGSGNSFVTGYFESSSIIFGSVTLTNALGGNPDMFVVKYNPSGTVLWAKKAGATGNSWEQAYGISTDASGNSFVTGSFSTSITFGATTLTGGGMFLVKYDANGNPLWAKRGGGTININPRSVSADASGNAFVTGNFTNSSIIFGSDTLTNNGSPNLFVCKYDAIGNALWGKSTGGNANSYGKCIRADANGNVFVTGNFIFGPFIFGSDTLTYNFNGDDVFTAKLNGPVIGIAEANNEISLVVSPNPTTGKFNVQGLMANGNTSTINIYNTLGKKVYQSEIKKSEIDLSSHPSGMYFLHIRSGEGMAVKKIIVSR